MIIIVEKKLMDRCSDGDIIDDIKRIIASEGYDIMYTDDLCSVYIDRVIGKVRTTLGRV